VRVGCDKCDKCDNIKVFHNCDHIKVNQVNQFKYAVRFYGLGFGVSVFGFRD